MKIRILFMVPLMIAGCASGTPTPDESSLLPDYLLNHDVRQSTIKTTICKPGWTSTIRPPSSYTSKLKLQQLVGKVNTNPDDYEEDHWIPLEVGGSPTDIHNLWPEPIMEAKQKDSRENADHRAVCDGIMTLEQARLDMYKNWRPK